MRQKLTTNPSTLGTAPQHQKAIADGEDHFRAWQYNVADRFKGMTVEDIQKDLRSNCNPFAVCFEHVINDFIMGTGIRNANAFNARQVFYLGDKKWDKRSAVGVWNYTPVQWLPTLEEFIALQDIYTIVGVDNVPGSVPMSTYQFVSNTLFVFGEEGVGLTPAMQSMCKDIVEIPMYGSVRSLNCGTASGIIMHEFVSRLKKV